MRESETDPSHLIEDLTLVPLPVWWQNPWVWVLGAILLGLVGWGLKRWLGRPRVAPVPPYSGAYPPMPGEEALRRLGLLKSRLPALLEYELTIEASDVLRAFIEGQHQVPIRYQTSREFLEAAAASSAISAEQRPDLAGFLSFCDLVKFAQRPATRAEMVQAVDRAIHFVQATLQKAGSGGRP